MKPKTTLWDLEGHTRGKHLVLHHYLQAWFPILGSGAWSRGLLFVDGFAGPGMYRGGEEGSPLIALKAYVAAPPAARRTSAQFIFIEQDLPRAEFLRGLVAEMKPSLPEECSVEVVCGKFDESMTEVTEELRRGGTRPCFVMVDPFGVSDTPMAVLRDVLRNPSAEVYVSFMASYLERFSGTPEFEAALDDLFGCSDWREGVELLGDSRRTFFFDLYESQLRKAGAHNVLRMDLYQGPHLVYALFFATKNIKGSDVMKKAMWKVDPLGGYSFRGTKAPGGRQLQLGLGEPDGGPMRRLLLEEFAGKGWVTLTSVLDFVASDRTDYHTSHLRKLALAPLEEEGHLEVSVRGKRHGRCYPPSCNLKFIG